MPRVETGAEVTLVTLVYRSLKWLDWVMEGVERAQTDVKYRWLVVANDATEEVRADPRITLEWDNENKDEFYINRVYRAWNEGVTCAPTQLVCMLNSDMWPHDGWLDELMDEKEKWPRRIPTSLLVESGRIPSAMPEYSCALGTNPENFRPEAFASYAKDLVIVADKKSAVEPGRLFMPILVDRQEFMDVGGYPEGNPTGTTGDKDLIHRYKESGYEHVTCLGSVVYHCQEGEMRWPKCQ